jgi:hypothetical protein
VLVANPGTPRCEAFRREAADRGGDLAVVRWAEVVSRDGDLDTLPAFDRPAVVRLESPGKDPDVARLLLAAGTRDDPAEPPRDWLAADLPKGHLVRPGLLHRGFVRVLRGLRRAFDARPHLRPTACPLAVAHMFDKTAAARTLAAAGVPVPEMLPPEGFPDGAGAFHRHIRDTGWPVAYAKLNTGSSAVGMVVGHYPPGREPWALTTMADAGDGFASTRRVGRIDEPQMIRRLAFLRREGVVVQRGVPMARIDGDPFDVRVVCVAGRPVASIFRVNSVPITNLHLGGRRGDFARCRAAVPTRAWLDALDCCSAAAACFGSLVAGVDVVFEPGFGRHAVLEVNAFGDFFPGWRDAHGRSLHGIEIEETARPG